MRTTAFHLAVATLALAGCAAGDVDPLPTTDVGPGGTLIMEPNVRDPVGYSSRPTDSDPYTTELDGQGIPAARDQAGP